MTKIQKKARNRKNMEKHGASATPEYLSWSAMIQRCENPKATGYKNYGGRGVCICGRWRESFVSFLADMGYRPTIKHELDRLDVHGNYEPGNVIWATSAEGSTHRQKAILLCIHGATKHINEWAKEYNVPAKTLYSRLRAGWPEDLILDPVKKSGEHSIGSGNILIYEGVAQNIAAWSRDTDIPLPTLWERIYRRNMTLKDALTKGNMNNVKSLHATINGITKSVRQWCLDLDLDYTTIHYRIRKKNMTPESAIQMPVRKWIRR